MPEFVWKSRKELGFDIKPFPQWADQVDALRAENSHMFMLSKMGRHRLNRRFEVNLK
jgi:hypothetical protein